MSERDLTKGKDLAMLSRAEHEAAVESKESLVQSVYNLFGNNESGYKFRQAVCELTGSLAAGITGATVFSVGTAATRGIGRAGSLGIAMTLSGAVKFSMKSGLEHLLLPEDKRTAKKEDFIWGAVDGLAGVGASVVEKEVSGNLMRSLGRKHLGQDISAKMAEMAGAKVLAQSVGAQMKHNVLRGLAGGAAGGFIWSVPHSAAGNFELMQKDPLAGLNAMKNQVLSDTLTGTILGGAFAGVGTALIKSPEIMRQGSSRLSGESNVTRLDIAHLNDLHSELTGAHGLPRIMTKLDELRAQSAANGRSNHFYVAGDTESGNVVFQFTRGGYVENEALARKGLQGIIPGNHPYDIAGGGYDVGRYVKVMNKVAEGRDLPLLAANLDLNAYPDYAKLVKPYVVHDIKGANGLEKVGVIGLITDEGAVSKIGFRDPIETAEKAIAELHAQGVKKVVVLSHMGLTDDIALARRVKGISAIVGGHSHDFEPVPRWITQGTSEGRQGLLGHLKGKPSDPFAGWDVPIVQAGSNGRWLGELNLAFKASGAADKYRTSGRLHPITNKVPAERDIERFISGYLDELKELKGMEYNSEAVAGYSLAGVRSRETALGNIISDAMLERLRQRLGPQSVDMMLMNSGAIRAGIKAHDPITRLDLSNIFMNAGKPNLETRELYVVNMTGRQVKDALEYGVHDMSAPAGVGGFNLRERLRQLMSDPKPPSYSSEPGGFLQVSGVKYSFDLTQEPRVPGAIDGGRVNNVLVANGKGQWMPIVDDQVYKVAARLHAIARWHSWGTFGSQRNLKTTLGLIGAENAKLSQVDLMGEFIQGRTLDPTKLGKVDGRIRDLTPEAWEPTLRPGISLIAPSVMSARHPYLSLDTTETPKQH